MSGIKMNTGRKAVEKAARLGMAAVMLALLILSIPSPVQASGVPGVTVLNVERDGYVDTQTLNFPADEIVYVWMRRVGTGVEYVTGVFNSADGGIMGVTSNIPSALYGAYQITIVFRGQTFTASATFVNNPLAAPTSGTTTSGGTEATSTSTSSAGIYVLNIVEDTSVDCQTYYFPADEPITVWMKRYGTSTEYSVGAFNSADGGVMGVTVNIPAALYGVYQITVIFRGASFTATNTFVNNPDGAPSGYVPSDSGTYTYSGSYGIPYTNVINVTQDSTVTLTGINFPHNLNVVVRIGAYGTYGVGGTVVDEFNPGDSGSFERTFTIPAAYAGASRLAIRFDSSNGYYAYDWFYNCNGTGYSPCTGASASSSSSSSSSSTSTTSEVPSWYAGYPYFYITGVSQDNSVTISGYNFPPNQTFTVQMGVYGSYGYGTTITSFDTGTGGTFTQTYTIPAGLAGTTRIAIRMDSNLGFYAYNWFWNADAP
jgi:hypothetical protein